MSLAIVRSRTQVGMSAIQVDVEVDLANGLPCFSVVGMPETAVRESKDRVRGAIVNSKFEFPAKRITVNLAPADVPKAGGRFDLPIAIGILLASGQIQCADIDQYELLGELALSGELKPIAGCLPAAIACCANQRALITDPNSAIEAVLVDGLSVYPAQFLTSVAAHLNAMQRLVRAQTSAVAETILDSNVEPSAKLSTELSAELSAEPTNSSNHLTKRRAQTEALLTAEGTPDLADIKGQYQGKRAIEIAAAGGHHLLFYGPPGAGKTMLASRLSGLLPPMNLADALQTATLYSVSSQGFDVSCWRQRPYRAPHHNCSAAALVGGGSNPKPGEISLAQNGVLFLDELPEFPRNVLDQLREPIETGWINIARANYSVRYCCQFQLVASMNLCKCGWYGDPSGQCSCTPTQVDSYRNKVSGPLLDRIDMHVHLPRLDIRDFQINTANEAKAVRETSAVVSKRVAEAQARQQQRQGKLNNKLTAQELQLFCHLNRDCERLLIKAGDKLYLSARAYHRIIKLARTIADLSGGEFIQLENIEEALSFRASY